MKTALHGGDVLSLQFSKHQLPLVSRCRRDGEMGDLMIGDDHRFFHLVTDISQTAAQYQSDLRTK